MRIDDRQYSVIVENVPAMICRIGQDGLADYFNRTWLDFTGRSMDQEFGRGWLRGIHPDDMTELEAAFTQSFAERQPFETSFRLKRHDGEWRFILACAKPFFDDEHFFRGYLACSRDITEQVNDERARQNAQIDGLTGILSRQYFLVRAGEEYERADRFRQNLCVAMIDIDNFKAVNDMYGQRIGDDALRMFAKALAGHVRKFDLVGRFSGDQFIVLFANTDLLQASLAMERLNSLLQQPMTLPGGINLSLTFSHGFAVRQQDASLEAVIRVAEDTLNRIKKV